MDRVYITNDGKVGIGTWVPVQKLDVIGNAYISGNVGIGTWNPAYKLEVVGSVGADAYYYRSDITLKEKTLRKEEKFHKESHTLQENVPQTYPEKEKEIEEKIYTLHLFKTPFNFYFRTILKHIPGVNFCFIFLSF